MGEYQQCDIQIIKEYTFQNLTKQVRDIEVLLIDIKLLYYKTARKIKLLNYERYLLELTNANVFEVQQDKKLSITNDPILQLKDALVLTRQLIRNVPRKRPFKSEQHRSNS